MNDNERKEFDTALEEHIAESVKQREEEAVKTAFPRELFFLLVLTALSCILVALSLQLFLKKPQANGPGTYPLIASGGMLLCSLIAIVSLVRKKKQNGGKTAPMKSLKLCLVTEVPFTVLVMAIATIAYVVAMSLVGFYISTFVYMSFSSFFLFEGKKEKLLQSLLVGAGTSFAIWLIIGQLFQIRMP